MAGGTIGGGDDDGGVISDINVTPLVDVTLVLLIIMMVTAPMLTQPTAIKVDLPKGRSGEALSPAGDKHRTLLVGKGGQIQIDGQMVTIDQLREKLTAEAKVRPDLEVGVAADAAAEYGSVIAALDAIRTAGVTKFSLQMEGDNSEAAAKAAAAAIGATQAGAAPAPAGEAVPGATPVAPAAAPAAPAAPAGAPR